MDGKKLSRTLADRVTSLIKEAARIYVRILIREIPVYSGRTAGSVLPLAQSLGNVAHVVTPVAKKSQINRGRSEGSYTIPRENARTIFRFEFQSDVPYYSYNDLTDMKGEHPNTWGKRLKKATPWHTQQHAIDEFEKYVNAGKRKLGKLGVKLEGAFVVLDWTFDLS